MLDEPSWILLSDILVNVRHQSDTFLDCVPPGEDMDILEFELPEDFFSGIPELRLIFFLLLLEVRKTAGADPYNIRVLLVRVFVSRLARIHK